MEARWLTIGDVLAFRSRIAASVTPACRLSGYGSNGQTTLSADGDGTTNGLICPVATSTTAAGSENPRWSAAVSLIAGPKSGNESSVMSVSCRPAATVQLPFQSAITNASPWSLTATTVSVC